MKFADAIYNGKTEIKNIIFDWGGVITDLHFDATKKAFHELGLVVFDESVPHDPHHDIFIPFEIGKISPQEFRNKLKALSIRQLTDADIDQAWCALLADLPSDRWHILEEVSKNFRAFILSNTNAIHQPYYYNRLRQLYGTDGYAHFFEKTYFSHELGMRKPDPEIFQFVLEDARLKPEETLFIDDFIENIETARKLGLQTIHLKTPLTLADVFVI